jgi:hypothetical protein
VRINRGFAGSRFPIQPEIAAIDGQGLSKPGIHENTELRSRGGDIKSQWAIHI